MEYRKALHRNCVGRIGRPLTRPRRAGVSSKPHLGGNGLTYSTHCSYWHVNPRLHTPSKSWRVEEFKKAAIRAARKTPTPPTPPLRALTTNGLPGEKNPRREGRDMSSSCGGEGERRCSRSVRSATAAGACAVLNTSAGVARTLLQMKTLP